MIIIDIIIRLSCDLTLILQDFIGKHGYIALAFFILGLFTGLLIIYCLFKNPDKLKKSLSYLLIIPAKFFVIARKAFITLDFEGRINDFVGRLGSTIHNYSPIGVKIRWVTSKNDSKSFFDDDNLIIVMKDSGIRWASAPSANRYSGRYFCHRRRRLLCWLLP